MPKYNRGSIAATLLLLVLALGLGTLYLAANLNADVARVQQVVDAGLASPDATEHIKAYLTEHPTPTYAQLFVLKNSVDALLVRDLSRRVTGNPALQTQAEMQRIAESAGKAREAETMARLKERRLVKTPDPLAEGTAARRNVEMGCLTVALLAGVYFVQLAWRKRKQEK